VAGLVGEGYLVGAGGVTSAAPPTLRERIEGRATGFSFSFSFVNRIPQSAGNGISAEIPVNFANSERKGILNSKTEIPFHSDRNFGYIDRNFGDLDRNLVFVDRKMMQINRK